VSYKTIGLKELEHYSLRYDAFKMISNLIPLELYLLQTCNRVEVYAFGSEEDFQALLKLLNDLHGKDVVHKGTVLKGREVVRHAFEVASGLDSLAIGEYEILRQMKEALESSKKAGISGPNLEFLITEAIKVGRRVRIATGISKGKVGTYVLAVEEAKERLGDLRGRKVLVLGAGEIGSKLALILYNEGVKDVFVMNRTFEKAEALAVKYGFKAVPFDLSRLEEFDVVFSAIDYPQKIRTNAFVIDLGVPSVFEGPRTITLADIERRGILERTKRMSEAYEASKLIEKYVNEFFVKFGRFTDGRALSVIMTRVEDLRRREVERALRELAKRGVEDDHVREILDKMTMSLIKKVFDPFFKAYYTSTEREKELMLEIVRKVLTNGNVSSP